MCARVPAPINLIPRCKKALAHAEGGTINMQMCMQMRGEGGPELAPTAASIGGARRQLHAAGRGGGRGRPRSTIIIIAPPRAPPPSLRPWPRLLGQRGMQPRQQPSGEGGGAGTPAGGGERRGRGRLGSPQQHPAKKKKKAPRLLCK